MKSQKAYATYKGMVTILSRLEFMGFEPAFFGNGDGITSSYFVPGGTTQLMVRGPIIVAVGRRYTHVFTIDSSEVPDNRHKIETKNAEMEVEDTIAKIKITGSESVSFVVGRDQDDSLWIWFRTGKTGVAKHDNSYLRIIRMLDAAGWFEDGTVTKRDGTPTGRARYRYTYRVRLSVGARNTSFYEVVDKNPVFGDPEENIVSNSDLTRVEKMIRERTTDEHDRFNLNVCKGGERAVRGRAQTGTRCRAEAFQVPKKRTDDDDDSDGDNGGGVQNERGDES